MVSDLKFEEAARDSARGTSCQVSQTCSDRLLVPLAEFPWHQEWEYGFPNMAYSHYLFLITLCPMVVALIILFTQPEGLHHTNTFEVQGTSLAILESDDCGDTVETAMSRGCVMDPMSGRLTPPRCYDSYIDDVWPYAYENATLGRSDRYGIDEFHYYEDDGLTRPLLTANDFLAFVKSFSNRSRRGDVFVQETVWHAAHCDYVALVGAQALSKLAVGKKDVWVPQLSLSEAHQKHCQHLHFLTWTHQFQGRPASSGIPDFVECHRLA